MVIDGFLVMIFFFLNGNLGTSLMVQWLGVSLAMQGTWFPVRKLESHVQQGN